MKIGGKENKKANRTFSDDALDKAPFHLRLLVAKDSYSNEGNDSMTCFMHALNLFKWYLLSSVLCMAGKGVFLY